MLLYYIRHGSPTYNPDKLTPLGHRQAEALARRLVRSGVDSIYASKSPRAYETALHTAEILQKSVTKLDFCDENDTWEDLVVTKEDGHRGWISETQAFMNPEVHAMGDKWYEHPSVYDPRFPACIDRICGGMDAFLLDCGYQRNEDGTYTQLRQNDEKVALFAHHETGMILLGHIFNLPYPYFKTRFSLCHTGLTAIEFSEWNGVVIPKMITSSNDSHLYEAGLPMQF